MTDSDCTFILRKDKYNPEYNLDDAEYISRIKSLDINTGYTKIYIAPGHNENIGKTAWFALCDILKVDDKVKHFCAYGCDIGSKNMLLLVKL